MKYLFDANVFIEAKNRYYAFDICPGFWDWMDHVVKNDAGSIGLVCEELCKGKDDLAAWANQRRNRPWFLKVDDNATQKAMQEVAVHVASGAYQPEAQAKFLSSADPWLIAKAQVIGAKVVTHETESPAARKRVPIPNVCAHLKVEWVAPFDVLRSMAASFTFKPPK
jgi:hypothetical protein